MRLFFITFFSLLVATSAFAAFGDGLKMKEMCRKESPLLTGYIAGWLDKLDTDFENLELGSAVSNDADIKSVLYDQAKKARSNICIPSGVSLGAVQDIVCRKMEVNAFLADWPAHAVIRAALTEAWPCENAD